MATAKNPKQPRVEFWSGKILYPVIVVLLVLSGFFALAILPRLVDTSHPLVGQAAPEFVLPVLPGTVQPGASTAPVALSSLRGRVVVLDFWAPWCKPCRQEMPELDKLSKKLGAEPVTFLGVMVDGDPLDARELIKALSIGYAQIDDETGKASKDYRVQTLPSIVIIDKLGTVRAYHVGTWDGDEVEAAVRAAL
jgi:cytochrome c biogenesis protein CcmG/thiol:disulfide interchange protein DsbE